VNFFPFHIGDYAVHTRHLTLMEDLAYRRLLDLYYTRDGNLPPAVDAARLIGMREQLTEVEAVWNEFFPEGRNKRADEELSKMHAKQENARASVAKRQAHASVTQASREHHAHQQTNTNNQEPSTKRERKPAAPSLTVEELKAEGLAEETATEFIAHRNRKGAKLTRRAWDGIAEEIAKSGWTADRAITKALSRGWVSFEADWIKDEKTRKADLAVATVPSNPDNFNRTREEPMTPEQWESARKAKALAMGAIKNITPKAAA